MRKSISYAVSGLMLIFGAAVGTAHAGTNDISLGSLAGAQSTFDGFVDELGTIIAYNPLSPAEPMGVLGFEVGIAISAVKIDTAIWDQVVGDGNAPSSLPIPRLMVRKGLPLGFDVGLSRIDVPGSNISVTGFELRKAIMEGSMVTPAVSVLIHSSKLSGVDDLDLSTYGIDIGISKGFVMLTPYAGVGQVWVDGSENAGLGLADRDSSTTRSYFGVRIGFLPFMNLVVQADIAEVNSYSLRLNIGF